MEQLSEKLGEDIFCSICSVVLILNAILLKQKYSLQADLEGVCLYFEIYEQCPRP